MSKRESDDDDNTIERAFELLKEAKEFEESSDDSSALWSATASYYKAHTILQNLASSAPRLTDDEIKTATLLSTKASEYFHKSRHCLIKALTCEKQTDETIEQEPNEEEGEVNRNNTADDSTTINDKPPPTDQLSSLLPVAPDTRLPSLTGRNRQFIYATIDNETAQIRNQTFIDLFSRPVESVSKNENDPQRGGAEEEEQDTEKSPPQSLEERLAALNQSLPSNFKTTEERLEDINRGMNKLGLSVFPQSKPFSRVLRQEQLEHDKSEDEQIDDIIAMAQEEADLKRQEAERERSSSSSSTDPKTRNSKDDDDDDDDDSDDDDDDEADGDELILDDEQLAVKKIRRRIVKAQTKLSKLLSVLDQADVSLAEDDVEEEEKILRGDGDDDSIDEIPKVPAHFFLSSGKKQLQSVQRDLRKAMKRWNEEIDS